MHEYAEISLPATDAESAQMLTLLDMYGEQVIPFSGSEIMGDLRQAFF